MIKIILTNGNEIIVGSIMPVSADGRIYFILFDSRKNKVTGEIDFSDIALIEGC